MIKLELPYGVSANRSHRSNRGSVHLSISSRAYREEVLGIVLEYRQGEYASKVKRGEVPPLWVMPIKARLFASVYVYPPDRRRRDLDNNIKPIFDAIEKAGLIENDYQIWGFKAIRMPPVTGGKVILTLEDYEDRFLEVEEPRHT